MENADQHARSKAAQQEVSVTTSPLSPVHLIARPSSAHRLFGLDQDSELPPSGGPDVQFRPVAQGESMEDVTIRGHAMGTRTQPSSHLAQPDGSRNADSQLGVRAPSPAPSARLVRTGYPFVRQPAPSHSDVAASVRTSFHQSPPSRSSPMERFNALSVGKGMMNPSLQFMCGPLLRYDTVDEDGVWHGAALIVSGWPLHLYSEIAAPVLISPLIVGPHSKPRMPGRRTSRIRLSSTAGTPKIPHPSIIVVATRLYWNRASPARSFTCMVDATGTSALHPPDLVESSMGIFRHR